MIIEPMALKKAHGRRSESLLKAVFPPNPSKLTSWCCCSHLTAVRRVHHNVKKNTRSPTKEKRKKREIENLHREYYKMTSKKRCTSDN